MHVNDPSILSGFVNNRKLPLNLHFLFNTATIIAETNQHDFMANLDWPFKLVIAGEPYTLLSRGCYGHNHYLSKVHQHSGGLIGVWHHNDLNKNGYHFLISQVPSIIGGFSPETALVMYLCQLTAKEGSLFKKATIQLDKDYPVATRLTTFKNLKEVLVLDLNRAIESAKLLNN